MKFISHRGNIRGREEEKENLPQRIEECLQLGLDVEIDVWCVDGRLFLGHDKPEHTVSIDFLRRERIWCHTKNINALSILSDEPDVHCFWHQEDDYTITSRGVIWVYPGKTLTKKSICVMPEKSDYTHEQMGLCSGICSDYILEYQMRFSK